MQPYVKIYMTAFDYCEDDFIPSELSPHKRAVDVHHIDARGMGGTKQEDRIEELIGLTREEHIKYGDKKEWMSFLYKNHRSVLRAHSIQFDEDYMQQKINFYENFA